MRAQGGKRKGLARAGFGTGGGGGYGTERIVESRGRGKGGKA